MEYLNFENFLWLQATLVLVGIFYLLRRGRQTGLRMRWKEREGRLVPNEMSAQPRMWDGTVPNSRRRINESTRENTPSTERVLNVHFNFNGHSWDAFEVLGLPAGSPLEKVEAALQDALLRSSNESHELYQMACEAIRKSKK